MHSPKRPLSSLWLVGVAWIGSWIFAICQADGLKLDLSTNLFVGVTRLHFGATNPAQSINVVDIDLGAPGIRFFVTPQIQGLPTNSTGTPYTVRRQYTLDFLNQQGAQVAVDAHRYWPTAGTDGSPVNLEGVAASAGSVYESFFNAGRAPSPTNISWPALNIGASNDVAILYGSTNDPVGHTPLQEVDDLLGHHTVSLRGLHGRQGPAWLFRG